MSFWVIWLCDFMLMLSFILGCVVLPVLTLWAFEVGRTRLGIGLSILGVVLIAGLASLGTATDSWKKTHPSDQTTKECPNE